MSVDHRHPGGPRLVGRARELARLRSLVTEPPPGSVIMVTGEAGIGKTALVNQLVADRRAAGDDVLRGAGDERAPARFSVWRRVMRDLGIAQPHADPSVAAADQVDELSATIGDSLRGGARTIVLEDVHWADDASIGVLQLVAERLIGAAVALVATARSGAAWSAALTEVHRKAELVALVGLTAADIEAIALDQTGETMAPDIATALHRRTGGNPLLVREVLSSSAATLSRASGGLLTSAMNALGPATADVLGTLAIAGRAAPPAATAHAMSMSIDEVELHARRAVEADILTSEPDGEWFRHELLADAAADRFDAGSRRAVHRSLATFWANAPGLDDDGLERARHLLAASPSTPPLEDADALLETAAALRRRRRAGDAADLLHRAVSAWGAAPPPLPTRLWLALGEARWDLAEGTAAVECFARAADAVGEDDPTLAAMIEVARQRHHNPLVPDPVARRRLAALDEQLPTGDTALRSALLGRRAMLALQPPARRDEACAFADAALAMARRLDDPDALLTALCDRAFVVGSAADVLRRRDLADEVLELTRTSSRPDQAVAGHEWRFDDCLIRGDLVAAVRALDEFEALASVAPSPHWQFASSLRRAMLLLAQGDRIGAVETVEATVHAASGLVDPFELIGLELGIRAPAMILGGVADPGIVALQEQMVDLFDNVPSPFMQVRLAVGDVLVGDRAAAQRRAPRWLADPARAFEAPDPVGTLGLMALLADELHMVEPSAAIATSLREFAGLLAGGIPLPVDLLLARLAILVGRSDDAHAHARRALELARSMPSPVIEAHSLAGLAAAQLAAGSRAAAARTAAAAEAIADHNGVVLAAAWSRRAVGDGSTAAAPGDAVAGAPRTARIERDGDIWRISSGRESAMLAHIAGLEPLARLVQVPGLEVSAVELAGARRAAAADLGPAIDARAKREYRRRINELHVEIDTAEQWNDPARAESARVELDALLAELRRAVGLSGRDRPQGSESERARINATRNIRRAISAIGKVAPDLAAHLTVSVRTGHVCSYSPEPAAVVRWEVDLGRRPA